ncbi:hypothetical protein DFS34DRAFT_619392 [Phlyctochytrium arcticum]|nr:hypothetical protein DFS34DRAFT_619392 [Phlyctochytrium arcticum]
MSSLFDDLLLSFGRRRQRRASLAAGTLSGLPAQANNPANMPTGSSSSAPRNPIMTDPGLLDDSDPDDDSAAVLVGSNPGLATAAATVIMAAADGGTYVGRRHRRMSSHAHHVYCQHHRTHSGGARRVVHDEMDVRDGSGHHQYYSTGDDNHYCGDEEGPTLPRSVSVPMLESGRTPGPDSSNAIAIPASGRRRNHSVRSNVSTGSPGSHHHHHHNQNHVTSVAPVAVLPSPSPPSCLQYPSLSSSPNTSGATAGSGVQWKEGLLARPPLPLSASSGSGATGTATNSDDQNNISSEGEPSPSAEQSWRDRPTSSSEHEMTYVNSGRNPLLSLAAAALAASASSSRPVSNSTASTATTLADIKKNDLVDPVLAAMDNDDRDSIIYSTNGVGIVGKNNSGGRKGNDNRQNRRPSYCSTCNNDDTLDRKNSYKDHRSVHTIISGIDPLDLITKRDFLIKLSRACAMYGSPGHRLEFHLRTVSEAIGVESNYFALPSLMLISFGNEDHSSTTHLVKAPQGFNMSKLSAVNALCNSVEQGEILMEEALARLTDIRAMHEYSRSVFLASFPITSFGISLMGFGLGWIEALISGALGLLVGLLVLAAERFVSFTYLLDFASALTVGILTRALRTIPAFECLNDTLVTLSALAVLLPGLSLTISIIEISTRNMVSGTVRMFHALFTAMLLGFGMSVGPLLITAPALSSTCPSTAISPYYYFLIFPPLSISLCVFFQARGTKQIAIMTVVSALGFITYYLLNLLPAVRKNGQISIVVSAFVIGLTSNIYARISRDVAVAPILAGILLLVPGSVGVRSTLGFLGANSTDGTNFAFQMLIIGMSITIGLFAASLVVWPIRGPKPKFMTF